MHRVVACLCLLMVVCGCNRNTLPEGVLSESQMASVLIEMYLAEERISRLTVPYDSVNSLIPVFREKVFLDAGISDDVYRKSMSYYLSNPKRLEYIYSVVVDSLSLREQREPNEYTRYDLPK